MNELTLKIDYRFTDKKLENYMQSLKGIHECKINDKENSIYIQYDSNQISIKALKYEILTFLEDSKIPEIISFDKHFSGIKENYTINIEYICCEYDLKFKIEQLLLTNGIESASTDFNFEFYDSYSLENVLINITYDSHKMKLEEIKKLEEKFN